MRTIPRPDHQISRKQISPNALKVLYRLNKAGYQAYLVGGGVRDILLGKAPKDFDIATDATPEQIKALFSNCRLIGRRFRLAHIHFGREIIETATFRASHKEGSTADQASSDESGMIRRDNVWGNLDDDAERRDFTINGLYYNIDDFSVIDFSNGVEDLKAKKIRMIGDPETRYREDPVRMLRAARFAAKLDFEIEPNTATCIPSLATLLEDIPSARLFEEFLKLFFSGHAAASFEQLSRFGLFAVLFPQTADCLKDPEHGEGYRKLIHQACLNTDSRIKNDQPVTPAFLMAVILWPAIQRAHDHQLNKGTEAHIAEHNAINDVLEQQLSRISIPKRFSLPTREMWSLQFRLHKRQGRRAWRLFEHPRFRAAYDILLLRKESGEDCAELTDWWTEFQTGGTEEKSKMVRQLGGPKKRRPRRRRKPSGKSSGAAEQPTSDQGSFE
ncbi:polynucleotide adenylyltransferase PcnB [Pelagibaculum spongiae]|uniref:Poly(A) polymerase I n=1 Tax=Pelagibaculum spongiae TaxID=2080658 RepID=A0A2V1GZY5_9GAMM|nr:polynucleotide adenylyltransferase PcnB [Pelagibaculum spongiae]PVZ72306.1 polynucleotide adenylyltransferase PcnB [Pelagibaculum spongiae]